MVNRLLRSTRVPIAPRRPGEPGSAEVMVFAISVEYAGLSPRRAQKVEIDVGNTMSRLGWKAR